MDWYWIVIIFFSVSVIYSSAGFGGGSSYIAVLIFTGLAVPEVRTSALVCNIIVVLSSLIILFRAKQLQWKKLLLLVSLSAPMSFVGGMISLDRKVFLLTLGSLLVVSSILMFLNKKKEVEVEEKPAWFSLVAGGGIGLLSGLVGIGGGIFLAPFLYFTKWGTAKQIAGATAFFIAVNSIMGLIGNVASDNFGYFYLLPYLVVAVLVGGQIGIRMTVRLFSPRVLYRVVAVVIFIAGSKIVYDQLA